MQMISVRELRTQGSKTWRGLKKGDEFLLTSNGKPIGMLFPVRDEDIEENIRMMRKARAIIALERLREEAIRLGYDKATPEDIEAWIKEARKK